MDIARIWEQKPIGQFRGALGRWRIPQHASSCAIVLTHGDDLGTEDGRLVSRWHQWHYLFENSDVHHYTHEAGVIWFERGKSKPTNIPNCPDGYKFWQNDYNEMYRDRLQLIANYLRNRFLRIEAFIKEEDHFRNLSFRYKTVRRPPSELIFPYSPDVRFPPNLER